MKFFVTGVGGQLGHDVMNELLKRGHKGVGSDIQESYSGVADDSAVTKAPYVALDITDKNAVEKVITEVNPDAVIHCAAWTAVDMAEDDDKVAKVRAINAGGTQNIADVCKKLDCKMTYISTDYVFDGQGTEPWQPDCKDYKPLNVYGQTKLEGELAVSQTLEKYFIVRIAWVFGLNGKNFIKTMLNVGKTHDTVRVVNDQIGTPTYICVLQRKDRKSIAITPCAAEHPMSFKVPDRLLTDGQCRMMINGIQFIQVLLEANGLAAGKDYQFKGRYDAEKNAVIISLEKDEQSALSPQKCTT